MSDYTPNPDQPGWLTTGIDLISAVSSANSGALDDSQVFGMGASTDNASLLAS